MAFLASFLQYFVIFVILGAVAALGAVVGTKLRKKKNENKSVVVEATEE